MRNAIVRIHGVDGGAASLPLFTRPALAVCEDVRAVAEYVGEVLQVTLLCLQSLSLLLVFQKV